MCAITIFPLYDSVNPLPALVPIDSDLPALEPGIVELKVRRFSSLLAQIEVVSCFNQNHCSVSDLSVSEPSCMQ